MSLKFNPFTGTFDFVGDGTGSTFDIDTVLTSQFFEVLMDQNGNILVGE